MYTFESTNLIQSLLKLLQDSYHCEIYAKIETGHVELKTRLLGQSLKKPCKHFRGHSIDKNFMKLCQNVYLYNILARFKCELCWVKKLGH